MTYAVSESSGRDCGHCKTEYTRVANNSERRIYSCDGGCGAYEVITKGGGPWWYRGAKLPEDMAPAWLEMCCSAFDAVSA